MLWVIGMFSIFIHEIGHAIGYFLTTKNNNWSIRLGNGKKICKIGRFSIYLIPFSGCFSFINTEKPLSKTKTIATSVGGPLASLILLLILFLVKNNINSLLQPIVALTARDSLIKYFIAYNLYMFVLSILPYKPKSWLLNGYVSDGWYILKEIKRNGDN